MKMQKCFVCPKSFHSIEKCRRAMNLPFMEFQKMCTSTRHCFKCLSKDWTPNHYCNHKCQYCQASHNELMCPSNPNRNVQKSSAPARSKNCANELEQMRKTAEMMQQALEGFSSSPYPLDRGRGRGVRNDYQNQSGGFRGSHGHGSGYRGRGSRGRGFGYRGGRGSNTNYYQSNPQNENPQNQNHNRNDQN